MIALRVPVFPSKVGTPVDANKLRHNIVKPTVEAARIDGFTPHVARHTIASLLIDRGLEPFVVSRQLGHSDPGFTMRAYGHLFDAKRHADALRASLDEDFGAVLRLGPA